MRKARPAARQGTDYDLNGNLTVEQDAPIGSLGDTSVLVPIVSQQVGDDVYKEDYGWAISNPDKKKGVVGSDVYQRTFIWDERNMMTQSSDSLHTVKYRYGSDGQRTNKYSIATDKGESIYFNKLWTWRHDSFTPSAGNYCKNIFLDKTRIVTKVRAADETSSADAHREYFYHGDHLQSATLITDYEGSVYERINYTPYGELWLEKSDNNGENYLPYRFTGKELDSETGLYYYGARYLDPMYSRWLSTDPALGEYIPQAPISDEAKKHNQNLPGMGGLFNHINFNLYHYAGNNPVRYTDPDGREAGDEFDTIDDAAKDFAMTYNDDSVRDNVEIATFIRKKINGKFFYDLPHSSGDPHKVYSSYHKSEKDIVAHAHTHGAYYQEESKEFPGLIFKIFNGPSQIDIETADKTNLIEYIAHPSGLLQKYVPPSSKGKLGELFLVSDDIPCDMKSPERSNSNDSNKYPANKYTRSDTK